MRLVNVVVENFRCYKAPLHVSFGDFTALVGKNDAGKSTIMDALQTFFDDTLDETDATIGSDPRKVCVTCTFDHLPSSLIVDEDFETSLAAEHLLDDKGHLQIRKTFDAVKGKVSGVEAIAMHPTAAKYDDLLHLKQKDLHKRAEELGVDLTNVNKAANAPVRKAIWDSCPNLQKKLIAISLDKEGAKQAWLKLSEAMPAFQLFKADRASSDQDDEAQDPLKAAIKEAIQAVEPQLQQIRDKVDEHVRKLAATTVDKIREMDPTLASTLDPQISHKKWDSLFNTSLTGDGGIPINKRGSGVRRLVLLNFFRAAAESAATETKGSIIYAIEEPETSQHPRNQRMLLSALRDLSGTVGRQVIMTTHTPMLARALPDDALRFVDTHANGTRTVTMGGNVANQSIATSLGVLADHSVKLFIGVEGKHDIDFLRAISKVLINAGQNVPDLEALELAGTIVFIPCGGSSLVLWADRLSQLNRPEFHVTDRDNAPPQQSKYHAHLTAVNARQGCKGVCTSKREMENYLHPDAVAEVYAANQIALNFPGPFADFEDVPLSVAQAVHAQGAPGVAFPNDVEKVRKKVGAAKEALNKHATKRMTVQRLQQTDPNNEIIGWLTDIRDMIAAAP